MRAARFVGARSRRSSASAIDDGANLPFVVYRAVPTNDPVRVHHEGRRQLDHAVSSGQRVLGIVNDRERQTVTRHHAARALGIVVLGNADHR